MCRIFKPRTHGQIKYPLFAQVLDLYEVKLSKFAQVKGDLYAHVYKASGCKMLWAAFVKTQYPTNLFEILHLEKQLIDSSLPHDQQILWLGN